MSDCKQTVGRIVLFELAETGESMTTCSLVLYNCRQNRILWNSVYLNSNSSSMVSEWQPASHFEEPLLCFDIASISLFPPQEFDPSQYSPCPTDCFFYKYNDEGLFQTNIFNLQIYNILGFLWCINFVIALGQCVLAGAFASYYWALKKPNDIPTCAVASSFIRTLRWVQPVGDYLILMRMMCQNSEPPTWE